MGYSFPAPISNQIWDMKYRFKDPQGQPIDFTVENTWRRIADALAMAEGQDAPDVGAADVVRNRWSNTFYRALEGMKYLPAGRIVAGAGTARAVTLFNCFVMGTIPDSMDGIFSMLREAALTMQQGGGIGYDFSTIRPKTSRVKKLGADASGPLSFMDCWDAMCRTVMSAGSRRGAMMATMCCDHPDIVDFITAKSDAKRLRMFNLSVLVTDDFMKAVEDDTSIPLVHVEPPAVDPMELEIHDHNGETERDGKGLPRYVHGWMAARELWDLIIRNTYDQAEPGVLFIDRINRDNNLNYVEKISSSNPCGEQPLPPYGACLLGSINLAMLVENPFTDTAGIDRNELAKLVKTAVRMMDNVIDTSNFPLPQQRDEAKAKRRIGLGVTGLADALAMFQLRYGTVEAAARAEEWMKLIDHAAYRASVELAREKGAFPLFDADQYLAPGTHASKLPLGIQDDIREFGIRNALLTSIAPTGTISLYAGNVSSGVEPIFALSYMRKVLNPDGSHFEELVEDYAVAAYREFYQDNIREPGDMEFDPDRDLPDYFVTAQTLTPEDHVRMQAAVQKHVDSSISKTINCPEDISFEDFKNVYELAYSTGCKGCTTYRPNDITGSVLSVDEKPKDKAPRDATRHQLTVLDPDGGTILMGYANEVRIDKLDGTGRYEVLDYTITAEVFEGIGAVQSEGVSWDEGPKVAVDDLRITAEMETGPGRNYPIPNSVEVSYPEEPLPKRPEELEGSTYKIKVGDLKAVYLTINDTVESDGQVRPFEIFLRSSDPQHDEWMVALARMVSAIMRRPYDASFIGPELMRIASPVTGGFQPGAGYQPSLVAAIGRKIKEHAERSKRTMQSELKRVMTENPKWAMEMGTEPDFSWPAKATGIADPADAVQAVTRRETVATYPGSPCPKCGSFQMKREAGCETCMDCGHSKCG